MSASELLKGSELIDRAKVNPKQGIATAAKHCGYGDDLDKFSQQRDRACDSDRCWDRRSQRSDCRSANCLINRRNRNYPRSAISALRQYRASIGRSPLVGSGEISQLMEQLY